MNPWCNIHGVLGNNPKPGKVSYYLKITSLYELFYWPLTKKYRAHDLSGDTLIKTFVHSGHEVLNGRKIVTLSTFRFFKYEPICNEARYFIYVMNVKMFIVHMFSTLCTHYFPSCCLLNIPVSFLLIRALLQVTSWGILGRIAHFVFDSRWTDIIIIAPRRPHHTGGIQATLKPFYNDHLMGYFSAFWSSSRWLRAT